MPTECKCHSCSDDPPPTYTEQFRRECEARAVLSMPFEARRKYLERVAKKRGAKSGEILTQDVRDEWAKTRIRAGA